MYSGLSVAFITVWSKVQMTENDYWSWHAIEGLTTVIASEEKWKWEEEVQERINNLKDTLRYKGTTSAKEHRVALSMKEK